MTKAMYAFSGDPITYGHIDIIQRAAVVFDEVVVGIGINPDKKYLFTLEERTDMAQRALAMIPRVRVVPFKGLLVDYAYEHGVPVIIKGVRDEKDLAYEEILHQIGQSQQLGIDTFFLPATQDKAHISSSIVKAIQKDHGELHQYVPLYVKQCLEAKISGQYIVGITGEIGTGKSSLSKQLEALGKTRGIPVWHIELDHIGHAILGDLQEPAYRTIRQEIAATFGEDIKQKDGTINRKALGEIVFSNITYVKTINEILHKPIMVRLRNELRDKMGIILLNAALLVEAGTTYLCNNNVILVTADKQSQERRLRERQLDIIQIKRRLESQYTAEEKKSKLVDEIKKHRQGKMWTIDQSDGGDITESERVFDELIAELRFR